MSGNKEPLLDTSASFDEQEFPAHPFHTAGLRFLASGMEWFPECRDGGLDRYFYEELQAMAAAGVAGTALVSSCSSAVMMNGVEVRGMAPPGASLPSRWRGARREARAAFRSGVDLVNAHFALYAFPYLWDIPKHVPLVVNFQGPWAGEMRFQRPGWKGRAAAAVARHIERTVYRRADRVITLSKSFRQLLHADYKVPLDRIKVIPGALHLDRYFQTSARDVARRALGWEADRPTFVAVRRLAKRMGLDLLIQAVAQVRQHFPRVLLLIGGKGPERENLQSLIVRLGLTENARLLGFISEEELPSVYAAADCAVVPTVALEGFGLVTAESLACGTPVLGTPVGATPEILHPLQSDLVFREVTVSAIAEKLSVVLSGELVFPDAVRCRAYVERYGWAAVIPQVLSVFEEAIEEKKRPR